MSAPGWYPDPQDPRQIRWWDGQSWTDHVATQAPAPAGAVPPGAPVAPGVPPPKKGMNPALIGGIVVGIVVLVVIVAVGAILLGRSTTSTTANPATTVTPSTPVTSDRPTTTTVSDLDDLADAAGIPVLDEEGSVTHTHALVLIVADGDEIVVPAEIGIDERAGEIAAVHTHDETGAVHVESPTENDEYTLGQFLILWGVGSTDEEICQYFVDQPDCTIEVDVAGAGSVGLSEDDPLGPWPDDPAVRAEGLDTVLAQGAIVEVTITST